MGGLGLTLIQLNGSAFSGKLETQDKNTTAGSRCTSYSSYINAAWLLHWSHRRLESSALQLLAASICLILDVLQRDRQTDRSQMLLQSEM